MATRTTTLSMDITTDAAFRALGVWISDSLSTFGWVLQGSVFATGTNWTDVTTPAANNTARVTEVWAMDDALQATAPFFLRIEYGRTAAGMFGWRITCANAWTSGVTLGGVTLFDTGATYYGVTTANSNSMTHIASGDTNRIQFALAVSGTSWSVNNAVGLSIERRHAADGTDLATGFLFTRFTNSLPSTCASLAAAVGPNGATTFTSTAVPAGSYSAANMSFNSTVAILPMQWCLGAFQLGIGMVFFPAGAYSTGATFSCDFFGSTRTYYALDWSFSSVCDMAIRYD